MIHPFVSCTKKFSQNTSGGSLVWVWYRKVSILSFMSCDEHTLAHETFTYYLQNFSEETRENLEISQSGTSDRRPLF